MFWAPSKLCSEVPSSAKHDSSIERDLGGRQVELHCMLSSGFPISPHLRLAGKGESFPLLCNAAGWLGAIAALRGDPKHPHNFLNSSSGGLDASSGLYGYYTCEAARANNTSKTHVKTINKSVKRKEIDSVRKVGNLAP